MPILSTTISSPLGDLVACATDEGICLLEFHDRRMLPTQMKIVQSRFNDTVEEGDHPHFELLKKELDEYFQGTLKDFTVPVIAPGTPFQQSVWKELLNISYGVTRSYKQQAEALKQPLAVRAVANANGMNRIAIIIPCHRVIGDNGHLTGYGGGIWRKRKLLELEKANVPSKELTLF